MRDLFISIVALVFLACFTYGVVDYNRLAAATSFEHQAQIPQKGVSHDERY